MPKWGDSQYDTYYDYIERERRNEPGTSPESVIQSNTNKEISNQIRDLTGIIRDLATELRLTNKSITKLTNRIKKLEEKSNKIKPKSDMRHLRSL